MYFMPFGNGSKFIGKYVTIIPNVKFGYDITIGANPIVTTYPLKYIFKWIEVDVYL